MFSDFSAWIVAGSDCLCSQSSTLKQLVFFCDLRKLGLVGYRQKV